MKFDITNIDKETVNEQVAVTDTGQGNVLISPNLTLRSYDQQKFARRRKMGT
jgi:hypothetical protein